MKNIDREAFRVDYHYADNKEQAEVLTRKVLYALQLASSPVSLQELYRGLECGDIPLYLCLHTLVQKGYINGPSPYEYREGRRSHDEMMYSVREEN